MRLFRRLLDFLARLFDSSANIIDSIVDAAAGAFHWSTRTPTARDSQYQNHQRENYFHGIKSTPSCAKISTLTRELRAPKSPISADYLLNAIQQAGFARTFPRSKLRRFERPEDIPLLAKHFVDLVVKETKCPRRFGPNGREAHFGSLTIAWRPRR